MFDEEPEAPLHAECAYEIQHLEARQKNIKD